MEKTKAWKLGYAAYFRYATMLDCPYGIGTIEHKQWGDGLFDALSKDRSLFDSYEECNDESE